MRPSTLPRLRKDFGEARVTLDDRNQHMSQKRAYLLKTWGTYLGTLSFSVSRERGLEEPFGSHSIGKERHHEISAHLGWHQKRQYS